MNTDTRLNCGTIHLQPLYAPKCVEQPDQVSSRFALTSSFRTLQLMFLLHRPAFLQLVKPFLEILARFIDFWVTGSKTELNFSLSRTIFPQSALSIVSGMCTSR
jgi:hypothetical protein